MRAYLRTERRIQILWRLVVMTYVLVSQHTACCQSSEGEENVIRVMTYNAWNFDDGRGWDERRKHEVARAVADGDVDFVAWQELRKRRDGSNMLDDLKELLPDAYDYHGYAAGETYETSEEGVGFSTRLRVISTETRRLALGDGSDSNHRVCMRVTVQLPRGGSLSLFVAHFSYDRQQQVRNAEEVKEFALSTSRSPRIILGDLNVYNDYKAPLEVFARTETARGEEEVMFQDAWTLWDPSSVEDDRDGFTFPSWKPKNRCDRILLNGPGISLARSELWGRSKSKESAASDHLALVATLRYEVGHVDATPPIVTMWVAVAAAAAMLCIFVVLVSSRSNRHRCVRWCPRRSNGGLLSLPTTDRDGKVA